VWRRRRRRRRKRGELRNCLPFFFTLKNVGHRSIKQREPPLFKEKHIRMETKYNTHPIRIHPPIPISYHT